MSPSVARVALHTVHVVTFFVLLGTGVLLMAPTLRSAITGGYALTLGVTHKWAGVAFIALPIGLVAWAGPRRVFSPPAARSVRSYLQGIHVGVTVLFALLFTATGAVLWARRAMPLEIFDPGQWLHDGLTYAAIAVLGLHLVDVAAAALVGRLRAEPAPAQAEGSASRRSP